MFEETSSVRLRWFLNALQVLPFPVSSINSYFELFSTYYQIDVLLNYNVFLFHIFVKILVNNISVNNSSLSITVKSYKDY
jgi:hypothetical protein